MVLITPYIMYICNDKMNGDSFPRNQGKERKVEVIRRKKTTKHEEETNHSRREYKATGKEGKQD